MSKNDLKVGVIGAGGVSGGHFYAYKKTGVHIAAVADIDLKAANRAAQQYDIPHVFSDYREMLKLDIDAVSVCLPVFLHAPVTIAAFKAGKHVLCEKPIAMNKREAKQMAAAAKSAGKIFAYCGSRYKHDHNVLELKRLLDAGKLGHVYRVMVRSLRDCCRPGIEYQPHTTWWLDKKKAGGGAMLDIGVYDLDTVMWLLNWPKIKSVAGFTFTGWKPLPPKHLKITVDEHASAIIRCENNLFISIEESWAAHLPGCRVLHMLGTEAGAQLYPLTVYTHDKKLKFIEKPFKAPKPRPGHDLGGVEESFIAKLRGKKTPLMITPKQIVTVASIIDAIYQSAAEKREIKFTDN